MDIVFRDSLENNLIWLPEKGWGYYNVVANPYNHQYYQSYVDKADTEIGRALNTSRINLVDRFSPKAPVVDIGVGSGAFVKARQNTFGFDINPVAVEMLEKCQLFVDPYVRPFHSMTCWDSFEHIKDSRALLRGVLRFVFMSLPIFGGLNHLMMSKHFKKEEHCYYFTHDGLLSYMKEHDFHCVHHDDSETKIGREDIGTYVFERDF